MIGNGARWVRQAPTGSAELAAFAEDPELIVYEATEPGDLLRIRREVEGRAWARAHGLPTAETVAVDPDERWMVSRRLLDRPGEDIGYLEAAFEVAERIARTPVPQFRSRGATWRASRAAGPRNALRLAAAGVSPREFVATRAAAARLPLTVTVHNDFHRANVIRAGHREVAVIDWEYTTQGPRHHDFLRLLVDVREEPLAHTGWKLLRDSAPARDHHDIGVQLRWLALRAYGSEVSAPRSEREPARLAFKRRRWHRVREWTAGS